MEAGEETAGMGEGEERCEKSHKDDWFTGRLQCTEIIPLAAQLACTWSMMAKKDPCRLGGPL